MNTGKLQVDHKLLLQVENLGGAETVMKYVGLLMLTNVTLNSITLGGSPVYPIQVGRGLM